MLSLKQSINKGIKNGNEERNDKNEMNDHERRQREKSTSMEDKKRMN